MAGARPSSIQTFIAETPGQMVSSEGFASVCIRFSIFSPCIVACFAIFDASVSTFNLSLRQLSSVHSVHAQVSIDYFDFLPPRLAAGGGGCFWAVP